MWRLLFSACAVRLSGHDAVHCHCRYHFMPPRSIRFLQFLCRCTVWATVMAGGGWATYQFVIWAINVQGAMRIG